MEINFRELKDRLTPERIKNILLKYDVKPYRENDKYIVFPTACHNLTGGSNKLVYYKDSQMFKCYTECGDIFDIFTLVIKLNKLRGNNINIYDAIQICGIENNFLISTQNNTVTEDINYLYNLLKTKNKVIQLPQLDEDVLDRFIFDEKVLQLWYDEGISYESMKQFHIKYDPIDNCIIIPNYDINGNLISIRGRYLAENTEAKYKPICYNKKILSHPSSLSLYGIYQNKENIQKAHKCIIFEAEKSVLKMNSYYSNNISVATLGKNISNQQIKLLLSLGVTEILLAYDADYKDYFGMDSKRKEYIRLAKPLKTYFNVGILMDVNNILSYKNSPIDEGIEKFEQIMKYRIYI